MTIAEELGLEGMRPNQARHLDNQIHTLLFITENCPKRLQEEEWFKAHVSMVEYKTMCPWATLMKWAREIFDK
jgi:hypothetical protein